MKPLLTIIAMVKKEISLFLIIGILTVLIDFILYQYLYLVVEFDINLAKGVSFFSGTMFAYTSNRIFTFGYKNHVVGTLYRFIPLYTSTLIINVFANLGILHALNFLKYNEIIAFTSATLVSASINFIGMKFYVFKENIKEGI